MSAIGAILAGVAGKVGATVVGKVLGDRFAPAGTALAETVVEAVAGKLGIEPQAIPEQPEERLADAVLAVEAEMPELVLAHLEQQKATHAFLRADDKPGWVNGWQWFLMILWAWNGIAVAVLNWGFAADLPVIPWDALGWLTVIYQGLNMGGHWSSKMADKFLGRRA